MYIYVYIFICVCYTFYAPFFPKLKSCFWSLIYSTPTVLDLLVVCHLHLPVGDTSVFWCCV